MHFVILISETKWNETYLFMTQQNVVLIANWS